MYKECGNDTLAGGPTHIDWLIVPPRSDAVSVRRSLDVGQVVGRASSHRQTQLKMGTFALRCAYGAHGRSHREKPV